MIFSWLFDLKRYLLKFFLENNKMFPITMWVIGNSTTLWLHIFLVKELWESVARTFIWYPKLGAKLEISHKIDLRTEKTTVTTVTRHTSKFSKDTYGLHKI